MDYSLAVHSYSTHRVYVTAAIKKIRPDVKIDEIRVMIDTGCYNTMIPLWVAQHTGYDLGINRAVAIGGSVGVGRLYALDHLTIGGCAMHRVVVLAYPFTRGNELYDTLLLGTNVLNNWKFTIDRKESRFSFTENFPAWLPNQANPYQNYFNEQHEYVTTQQ